MEIVIVVSESNEVSEIEFSYIAHLLSFQQNINTSALVCPEDKIKNFIGGLGSIRKTEREVVNFRGEILNIIKIFT